jgi:LysR family transcriptional regulator, regulator for bpeEF and oprC
MDKLRGMQYLVKVVEARSFAGAARELNISPPAVTQMIAALEHQLGTSLLRRGSRGVSLTPDGAQYYRVCAQTVADLEAAESDLRAGRMRASGVLVVGMADRLACNCIMPELPDFLARHPDLRVDVRRVHTTEESIAAHVDVLLILAWQHYEDWISKDVAQTDFLTCAAPAYWRERGMPLDPDDLRSHTITAYRSSQGLVLDEWKYQRGAVAKSVALKSRLICDSREAQLAAAIGGCGVIRAGDLTIWRMLSHGLLVPALRDWKGLEAPPIRLLYRRSAAASPRVRAFAAFVDEVFTRLKAARAATGYPEPQPEPAPAWFRRLNRYPRGVAPNTPGP